MVLRLLTLYLFLQTVFFFAVALVYANFDRLEKAPQQTASLETNVLSVQSPSQVNVEIKAAPVSAKSGNTPSKKTASGNSSSTSYFLHTNIRATYFYVGEPADSSNGFIPNHESAWDGDWQSHFGGIDTPEARNGFWPAGFKPLENPFYVALPFFDFDHQGNLKESVKNIPWYEASSTRKSQLKNRWVKISYGTKVSYAQWEDVGPFETDDFAYVFGNALPKNQQGLRAGIDVSPAVRDFLGGGGSFLVNWQFVDENQVPDGPWREIVTTSDVSW